MRSTISNERPVIIGEGLVSDLYTYTDSRVTSPTHNLYKNTEYLPLYKLLIIEFPKLRQSRVEWRW